MEDEEDPTSISVGCIVRVKDYEFKEEMSFRIVGSKEADSREGKISNESPVGRALMGKEVGDIVKVITPAGQSKYKVLSIERG